MRENLCGQTNPDNFLVFENSAGKARMKNYICLALYIFLLWKSHCNLNVFMVSTVLHLQFWTFILLAFALFQLFQSFSIIVFPKPLWNWVLSVFDINFKTYLIDFVSVKHTICTNEFHYEDFSLDKLLSRTRVRLIISHFLNIPL